MGRGGVKEMENERKREWERLKEGNNQSSPTLSPPPLQGRGMVGEGRRGVGKGRKGRAKREGRDGRERGGG